MGSATGISSAIFDCSMIKQGGIIFIVFTTKNIVSYGVKRGVVMKKKVYFGALQPCNLFTYRVTHKG